MEKMRVLLYRLMSTLFLIWVCYLMFSGVVSFSNAYVKRQEYLSFEEDELYTEYIFENHWGYSENESKLIAKVIQSKGFSMRQGIKMLNILLKDDTHNLFGNISVSKVENIKSYYGFFYYLTIIVCTLTFITHFLGSKNKGIPVMILAIIWLCISISFSGLHDIMKVSGNIYAAIILMFFSCVFWGVSDIYLPAERRYTVLDIVTSEKICWIERLFAGVPSKNVKDIMICSSCKASNSIEAVFCRSCGKRLIPIEEGRTGKASEIKFSGGMKYQNDKKEVNEEKRLELYVVFDNVEFEKRLVENMCNCSKCNAENLIGTQNCKVCGEHI